MKVLLFFLFPLFLISCQKSRENTTDNLCHQEMKERFKSELRCTEKGKMEVNLYSGLYEGKRIYFVMTICPACNTVNPQYGYTCEGEEIQISNFLSKVSETREIYNSCTNSFINE